MLSLDMFFSAKNNRVNGKYIFFSGIAVFVSWVLHEMAHWAAGKLLGYDMIMGLNKASVVNGGFKSDCHYQMMSAAGPIFTLIEAVIIFMLMGQRRIFYLYPFLFTCFYMRLFATVISLRNPNDEARISKSLGIGTFTLPLIVTAILFFLVYKTSNRYQFSMKLNLITLVLTIFFSSILIGADQLFHIRIL